MTEHPASTRHDRLYRDPAHGRIFGVCAGIAEYFGIEPWTVRLIALLGLIFFTVPTAIAYLGARLLMKTRPRRLYRSDAEAGFWRAVRLDPADTTRALRHKYREIERRMRAVEAYVTSREFGLAREFRDLER